MWRDGPNPGVLITADPATVERSGSFVRFDSYPADGSHGANRRRNFKPEKPLVWHHDLPGLDASDIYESSVFS